MEHQIEIIYSGDLRTWSTHLQSGDDIITDAPVDNQGKGEAFSPTDLLASSLGSCMLTIMGISAKTQGINIDGTYATVKKVMGDEPRRIVEIHIDFTFIQPISEKHRTVLERAANHCPVSKSLHPDLKEVITFHYTEA
jgi:uncharacterized OsmC-like protein